MKNIILLIISCFLLTTIAHAYETDYDAPADNYESDQSESYQEPAQEEYPQEEPQEDRIETVQSDDFSDHYSSYN